MLLQGFPEAQRLAYLSRGVHDPYEDSRQLGRHVTGPQEAVDAPKTKYGVLHVLHACYIGWELGGIDKHVTCLCTDAVERICDKAWCPPRHILHCQGCFQIVMPERPAPAGPTKYHVLIHHVIGGIGEEILRLETFPWLHQPETACLGSARCPRASSVSSQRDMSS